MTNLGGSNDFISATLHSDKLILLARVGTDHKTWEGVIKTDCMSKCNSNVCYSSGNDMSMMCWSTTQSSVYPTALSHPRHENMTM